MMVDYDDSHLCGVVCLFFVVAIVWDFCVVVFFLFVIGSDVACCCCFAWGVVRTPGVSLFWQVIVVVGEIFSWVLWVSWFGDWSSLPPTWCELSGGYDCNVLKRNEARVG